MFGNDCRGSLRTVGAALALVVGLACHDLQGPGSDASPEPEDDPPASPGDDTPRTSLEALIVSNPASVPLPGSDDVAYVSLAPGSVPDGEDIWIRNRRTGLAVSGSLENGGVDPLPVMARAGDTLDIRLSVAGEETPEVEAVVPERRAPVIVRVDPPPDRTDVPLNAVLLVVFSEPIDPASVNAASVQLLRDATPVGGMLAVTDDGLLLTFTPNEPLAAGTEYAILVTEAIEDEDGDALEAALSSAFTTAFEASPPASPVVAVFDRITPWSFEGGRPSLTLFENRRFELSFPAPYVGPLVVFGGVYDVSEAGYVLAFDGGTSDDPWLATGTRAGDSLLVEHNLAMRENVPQQGFPPFEDGVYLASGTPTPPAPPLAGRIAFANAVGGADGPYIHVTGATGTTVLTRGTSPDWSPDGRRLAFARWPDAIDPSGGVYVIDEDGSNLSKLLDFAGDPDWSPDGSRIVFVDTAGVGVVGVDGSGRTTLLRPDVFAHPWGDGGLAQPAWSPDGRHIAFTVTRLAELQIDRVYVMDADGSNVRALTGEWGCNRSSPAWSPDGAEIAVTACGYVALVAADGSSYRWLGQGTLPAWSPDGHWVAQVTGRDVYLVDPNGGFPTELIPNGHSPSSGSTRLSWTEHD